MKKHSTKLYRKISPYESLIKRTLLQAGIIFTYLDLLQNKSAALMALKIQAAFEKDSPEEI